MQPAAGGTRPARRSRRTVLLAYAIGLFGLAMNAMISFLVPLRAAELGVALPVIGALVGTKALVEAVLSVHVGRFIDRVGPRRAFIVGAAGSAVVLLGFTVSTAVWALFACQFVLGTTRAAGWLGSQAYASALDVEAGRSAGHTGRFSFVANVGQIIGPLLVGVVAGVAGYQAAFGVLVAYAGTCALLGIGLEDLPRPAAKAGAAGTFRETLALLRERRMQVAMFLTFVRLWNPSLFTAFFPLFLVAGGVAAGVAGSVVSTIGLTATVITLGTGWLSRRSSAEVVTAAALACGAAGVAIAPFTTSIPLAYAPAIAIGIGQGLSLPLLITIVSRVAPPGQQGLALGLRSSANQAASAIGPAVGGPLIAAFGVSVGFLFSAIVGFTLLGLALALYRR